MRKLTYTNPAGVSIVLSDAFYGITSVTGLGIPGMDIQEKKAPYQDGSTYIDQLFDTREIVVEGIIGTGLLIDIYRYRRTMAAAFNPKLGPGTLTYENDNGSWYMDAVTPEGPEFANKNANEGAQKWMITFYCYDPYWKNVTEKQSILSGIGTVSVDNLGDVPCPVEFVLQGPITNPTIIDNTTGKFIKLTKTFTASEYAIIYTGFGEKVIYINSGELPVLEFPVSGLPIDEKGIMFSYIESSNGMSYLDLTSEFFTLATGTNEIKLIDGGSNTGMTLTIIYRERYVGV